MLCFIMFIMFMDMTDMNNDYISRGHCHAWMNSTATRGIWNHLNITQKMLVTVFYLKDITDMVWRQIWVFVHLPKIWPSCSLLVRCECRNMMKRKSLSPMPNSLWSRLSLYIPSKVPSRSMNVTTVYSPLLNPFRILHEKYNNLWVKFIWPCSPLLCVGCCLGCSGQV